MQERIGGGCTKDKTQKLGHRTGTKDLAKIGMDRGHWGRSWRLGKCQNKVGQDERYFLSCLLAHLLIAYGIEYEKKEEKEETEKGKKKTRTHKKRVELVRKRKLAGSQ